MTLDKKLNDAFEEMMKYRQSIGYATATYRSSVPPFINFCVKNHPLSARITQEMVDEWLTYHPYTVNSKAAFISLLREYTKYLNFLGYDDYIPDDDYVVKRIAFNPYLFTDDELSGLFKTIDSYVGKTCGKRYLPEVVLPVYSRLLYCCWSQARLAIFRPVELTNFRTYKNSQCTFSFRFTYLLFNGDNSPAVIATVSHLLPR